MSQFNEIKTLKELGYIAIDAPYSKCVQYLKICEDLKLNPYRSELFLSKRYHPDVGSVFVVFAGINGLNKLAHATGEYTGHDEPIHDGDKCSVTVYRNGNKFTASAFISEYKPEKPNKFWNDLTNVMIAKVCKAHALRSAFPELSYLYIEEEMASYLDNYSQVFNKTSQIEDQLDDILNKIKK